MAPVPADASSSGLPSRVEETFEPCPQFRIVVIGNSGVGKSSIVSSMFNISLNSEEPEIDIGHGRAGKADIEKAYSSKENSRFILHDSMGFEHGSTENWVIVEKFLRGRASKPGGLPLKECVHGIWLCLETPRTGSRIMQTGDEDLLKLAKELKIPVIAVFTKYDILVNEHLRKIGGAKSPEKTRKARAAAEAYFAGRIEEFGSTSISLMDVPCVKISNKPAYLRDTLLRLTDVTRKTLNDVEGELWVPWAAAQQVSAQQKVELSISEGFKKYWINLGVGDVFQGFRLLDCLARIHDDILLGWNFHDPLHLLSKDDFKATMIRLVDPFLTECMERRADDERSAKLGAATTQDTNIAFTKKLTAIGIGTDAINFLYEKYQGKPLTARYFGAYIVDLTLVLHRLFMQTLTEQPPRALTEKHIFCAMEHYKEKMSAEVHKRIENLEMKTHFEDAIAAFIRESLNSD